MLETFLKAPIFRGDDATHAIIPELGSNGYGAMTLAQTHGKLDTMLVRFVGAISVMAGPENRES